MNQKWYIDPYHSGMKYVSKVSTFLWSKSVFATPSCQRVHVPPYWWRQPLVALTQREVLVGVVPLVNVTIRVDWKLKLVHVQEIFRKRNI